MNGICGETHENSCLSSEHEAKLIDNDARRAVRECEEVHEAAEEIACASS
jgi:hypothetical protein